jgi:hypothetical protein
MNKNNFAFFFFFFQVHLPFRTLLKHGIYFQVHFLKRSITYVFLSQ